MNEGSYLCWERVHGLPSCESAEGRQVDVAENILDISLIKKKLGWFPKADIKDSIKKTLDWVKDN